MSKSPLLQGRNSGSSSVECTRCGGSAEVGTLLCENCQQNDVNQYIRGSIINISGTGDSFEQLGDKDPAKLWTWEELHKFRFGRKHSAHVDQILNSYQSNLRKYFIPALLCVLIPLVGPFLIILVCIFLALSAVLRTIIKHKCCALTCRDFLLACQRELFRKGFSMDDFEREYETYYKTLRISRFQTKPAPTIFEINEWYQENHRDIIYDHSEAVYDNFGELHVTPQEYRILLEDLEDLAKQNSGAMKPRTLFNCCLWTAFVLLIVEWVFAIGVFFLIAVFCTDWFGMDTRYCT